MQKWSRWLSNCLNSSLLLLFLVKLDQSINKIITIENTNEIFEYLSDLPKISIEPFEELGLSEWLHKMKELAYYYKISGLVEDCSESQIARITRYAICLHNHLGKQETYKFLEHLLSKKPNFSTASFVLYWFLMTLEETFITNSDILLIENSDVKIWIEMIMKKYLKTDVDRNYDDLMQIMMSKEYKLLQKDINMTLKKIINAMKSVEQRKKHAYITDVLRKTEEWFERAVKTDEQYLFMVDEVIHSKKKIKLRDTQKLSVLILLKHPNVFAQIATGEGKSFIIVAFAIIKALKKEKVHIVTSSAVLAQRDVQDNHDIYEKFKINVGHNCDEKLDLRKRSYSKNMIIYGELSHFQRDYLLDKFYGENILSDNTFDNIIVDEVDCMLVDRGNNMLYLSHNIAGFDKLESIYIYIWKWINQPVNLTSASISDIFNENELETAILHEIYDIVDKSDLTDINSEMSNQQIETLWYELINNNILDSKGRIKKKIITKNDFRCLSDDYKIYSERLSFLFQNRINRLRDICVPNYLIPFVELHLKTWIKSAIRALLMEQYQNYVIDVDRSGSRSDRSPCVVILDTDTGTDQVNSQWDEALHQFLQLKHGCKLSLQSLKSVFISNVTYFNQYKYKYGVTGTLGSEQERKLLSDIHGMKIVLVPTSKQKQFTPNDPIICKNESAWIQAIEDETLKILKEERSILIICETMKNVSLLKKKLSETIKCIKDIMLLTYVRDYEEFKFIDKLPCGFVIIATNLAGRGTDIKLSKELCEKGGLHVCMTYLPSSLRVEDQGFGRASRRGEKGSGRLIVINNDIDDETILRNFRDAAELKRISEVKSYYENHIKTEEEYFKKFKKVFEDLKTKIDKVEFKQVLLDSCLDKWAIWLDSMSKLIGNVEDAECKISADKSFDCLYQNLETLDVQEPFLRWVTDNPMRMVVLGKCFVDIGKNNDALKIFDAVISREPNFCEAAHYYKALICSGEEEKKTQLKEAYNLFYKHRTLSVIYLNIVDQVKDIRYTDIVQIQSYREQKKMLYEIYSEYLNSIVNILGIPIAPTTFPKLDKVLANKLCEKLAEAQLLTNIKINADFNENSLRKIAYDFNISYNTLHFLLQSKDIQDDKSLINKFKVNFSFANHEQFWDELEACEILMCSIKYISFHKDVLESYLKHYIAQIKTNINNNKHKMAKFIGKTTVILDEDKFNKDIKCPETLIIKERDLIDIIGLIYFTYLMNLELFSRNWIGDIDINKIDNNIYLQSFDSVNVTDLLEANINKRDAMEIIDHLTKEGILLYTSENKYRLIKKLNEINEVKLSFWKIYKDTVMHVLAECFVYRIALENIKEKILEDKNGSIEFYSKSAELLYVELMDNNIIEPRTLLYDQKKSKAFFKNIEEFTFKKKDLLYQLQSSFRCSNETIEEIRLEMNSTVFLENHWEQIRNQECIFMQELNKYNVTICDILQDLKTPSINDCRLVPNSLFKNEEMDIFKLNGLDSLLISKSCPWNRFLDIGYGIISIIVGLTMIRSFNLKGFAHLITGAAELISGVLHTTKWGHYLQNNIMVNAIRHHYNKVTNDYFGISINPTNDHKKIERVFKHINSSKNTSTRIEVFLKSVNELLIKSLIEHGDSAMLCMNKLQNYINDELKNVKTGAVLKKILHEVFKQLKLETKRSIKYDSYATNIQQYAKNIHISKEHIEEFWSCLYDTCSNTYVLEEYVFEPIEIEEQQNIIKIYLEKHFVEPFIFGGRRVIENLFLKCDLELYESLNDKSDKKEYESLKLKLYEDYHATEVLKEHRSVYIEDIINKSYLSILSNNKLMNKIRKFYLLADLIEDNIMLPEVYLDVMTHILPKILGFDFLTIHVDDTNIMRAYNTPNATTKSHLTITISLVNGKFQLYDNGHINDFKQLLNYPNNLYEAIDGTHDCILSKEKFAEVISTHIREDVQIQKVIKEIWMKIDGNGESDTPKIRRKDVLGEFNYEIEDVSENLNSIVAYKIRNAREESAVSRSEKTLPIPINETNTCNGNLNSLMADGTSDASRNSVNNKTEMIPPIPVNESNSQNDNLNTFLADSTQVTDRISADDNKAEKLSPMADGTLDAGRNSINNKTEMIPPIPDSTQVTDRISADDKAEKISPIPINKTNTRNGNFNSSLEGRTQDASRNSAYNKANNIPRPINKTDTTREFNKKQELELKEVLQKFANLFYGLSDEDSRTIIYETAKLNNFPLHFNEDRMVCQTWFEDFKKRHQLNLNINLSPKHKITLFLNQLDELMKKLSLSDGSRIFCLDETCFSGYDKDTDSDKSFTACCIVSANGKAFLPILIMPKVKFSKNILPRECWRSQSDGLPNSDIFPYIIQYFIKYSCSSKQNPTILILDKHHSHMSVKALNIAEKAGVHTLPLDFDISNKLLPFKMGIFESFRTVCKERIEKLSALYEKTSWPVNDVLKFVVPLLHSKISNSECIIKAFKTCGIFPLDKKIFEDNADI